MPTITAPEAVERLTRELETLPVLELLEIHDGLFGKRSYDEKEALKDPKPLMEKLVAAVRRSSDVGEVMHLWNTIIPRDRMIWYNEVEDKIHFGEREEDDDWR